MTLEFKVNRQDLIRLDNQKVVEKSINYLYAHFTFSDDWEGLNKKVLLRPLDVDASYGVEVGRNNTIKIPYDLLVFPGFVLCAVATNTKGDVKITTDGVAIDVELAPVEDGTDEPAVRYVTSDNKTIIVNKQADLLDLGIETKFEYIQDTYTLNLYAITYDEKTGDEIDTLLSSIELPPGIADITTELSHTEDGVTTYRNLVFEYANGDIKRVSLDYFWNEIRADLRLAVTNLNTRITNEVEALNVRITGEVDALNTRIDNEVSTLNETIDILGEDLTQAINDEQSRAESAESNLNTKINTEITNRQNADTTLQTNINNEANARISADDVLQSHLTDEASARTSADTTLQNNINAETLARQNADSTLQTNINNEATTRSNADSTLQSNIEAEELRATTQEGILQDNIDSEATARANADTTLQGNIDSEATTRANADTTLQTNINNEATARANADTEITNALNTHKLDKNNPHQVTKAQVGLGNVQNTSDSNTPAQDGTQKFTTGGAYALKNNLEQSIQNESDRAVAQEIILDEKINGLEETTNSKINENVKIKPNANEFTYVGDVVTKIEQYKNLNTGTTSTRQEVLQLANNQNAGLMSPSDVQQIANLTSRIENIEGQTTRLIYTDSQNPTQQDISDFVDDYLASKGIVDPQPEDYTGIAVVVSGTYHIWHYYANDNIGWRDDGQDTVSQFSQSVAGIIKGKNADGFVYAESDGTGSVKGWNELKNRVSTLENDSATKTELANEVSTLNSSINATNREVSNVKNDLSNEELARQQADINLQDNIDEETTNRLIEDTILEDRIEQLATDTQIGLDTKVDKTSIGIVSLSSTTTSGIITLEMYDKLTRDIAVIKYGGKVLYKVRRTNQENLMLFTGEITKSTITSQDKIYYQFSQDSITLNTETLAYEYAQINTISLYDTTQIDTFLSTLDSDKVDKTTTVNGHALSGDVTVTKGDVGLSNVTNDQQVKGLASGTTENHILVFGEDGYTIKDSGKTLEDTGKIDTISIEGVDIPADANKNVDLPTVRTDVNNQVLTLVQKTNAKTNLDLENVANTGDSATPVENGTTKFTTGGAYTMQNALQDAIDEETTRAMVQEAILDGEIDDYSFKNITNINIETAVANAKNSVWQ